MYNSTFSQSSSVSFYDQTNSSTGATSSSGTCMPTIPTRFANYTGYGSQDISVNILNSCVRSHVSPFNAAWLGIDTDVWWWYQFSSGGTNTTTCTDTIRTTGQLFYGYNQNIRG